MLRAVIWDVDGTLAETERDGHRMAFNAAFAELGLSWYWSVPHYGELLHITGGYERLLHDMTSRADAPPLQPEREHLARALPGPRIATTPSTSSAAPLPCGPACAS